MTTEERTNTDSCPYSANSHKITQFVHFSLALPPSHSQPWSPLVSLPADTVAALSPGEGPPGTGCWHVLHAGLPAELLGAICLGHSHGSGGAGDTLTGTRAFIILLLSRGTHGSRWALQWGHEGGLNSSCCWGSSPAWDYQKRDRAGEINHIQGGGIKEACKTDNHLKKSTCHHLAGTVPKGLGT